MVKPHNVYTAGNWVPVVVSWMDVLCSHQWDPRLRRSVAGRLKNLTQALPWRIAACAVSQQLGQVLGILTQFFPHLLEARNAVKPAKRFNWPLPVAKHVVVDAIRDGGADPLRSLVVPVPAAQRNNAKGPWSPLEVP